MDSKGSFRTANQNFPNGVKFRLCFPTSFYGGSQGPTHIINITRSNKNIKHLNN